MIAAILLILAVGSASPEADQINALTKRVLASPSMHDEPYLHAYDRYVGCFQSSIENALPVDVNDSAATDAMFGNAFRACAPEKQRALAAATARLAIIEPEWSPAKQQGVLAAHHRAIDVLDLQGFADRKGLKAQYEGYFRRANAQAQGLKDKN